MLRSLALIAALAPLAACSTYQIGADPNAGPGGSYAGSTLNSPVTDQNPHVGGDSSYATGAQGKTPPPPDKADLR